MTAVEIAAVAVAALGAATLAGVAGFGGAVVLLPVLVAAFGARDAVVVLTIAQLASNGGRVLFNRHDVDGTVLGRFSVGAVPFAIAGGLLFAAVPADLLTRLLGVFLLASLLYRRTRSAPPRRPALWSFTAIGAVFGFLSGLLGSVGPLLAPFFLAYGLVKSAYIGTEAAATTVMHITKLATYGGTGVLTAHAATYGLALAPIMLAGSYAGKRLLDRMPERIFVAVIELVLLVAGILLLINPT